MTSPITTIAWDFDGVLNRNIVGGQFLWTRSFEADIGHSPSHFAKTIFGTGWDDVLVGRADLRNRVAEWIDTVGCVTNPDALLDYWFAHDNLPDARLPGVLDRFREQGLRQVIATNNEARRAAYIEKQMGFGARVDRVFASGRIGARKPSPAFFEAITVTLNAPPDSVVLIDDLAANVEAARAAGWQALQFHEGQYGVLIEGLAALGLSPSG